MEDYKVFYRKYRPKNFNELIGQDNIKEVLINSIKLKKIAHSYIFTGPRGTGKTSTAKIFAKTLNCTNNESGISCDECDMCLNYNNSADIIEIDAASNNGVEEIRSLRDSVKIAPYNSKYKVYIIDEVHMLSNSAWNAFLKTLEEPPSHVIFILATTEINKIPDTVKSRCQRFDFSKISDDIMNDYLRDICNKEKITIEKDAINLIVTLSNGCLRDALSYLDKISKLDSNITVDLIEENFGILNNKKLQELYDNIKSNNIDLISDNIDKISKLGVTPLNFINEFINFMVNKIINKEVSNNKEIEFIKEIVNKLNSLIVNFNSVINPFILIKVELITINYFPGNNIVEKRESNNEENHQQNSENIIVMKDKNHSVNEEDETPNIKDIKQIRINNSFVNPSKNLKKDFSINWSKLLEKIGESNDYNLLGMIENVNIEVVSSTNVIFSLDKDNESVIFNDNISTIENSYNSQYNSNYKFISLSKKEWNEEKNKFIKNKNKHYEYIDELNLDTSNDSSAQDLAEDLFGNKIIEIR